jgi:hypothetical protein
LPQCDKCSGIQEAIKRYMLYFEHIRTHGAGLVLDFTCAWALVHFFGSRLLETARCHCCNEQFVAHVYDPHTNHMLRPVLAARRQDAKGTRKQPVA